MPPKKAPAKKKNGYQMPEKFDEGFVLKDGFKANWTLGKPIGQGGFGLIYLASKGESRIKNSDDAQFVIKIEPKENGPLFCESHFYVNCCKENDIKNFMRVKSLKHLAMPRFIAQGLCEYKEKEYRFLVMDRYVKDLQSFLEQSPKVNEIGVMCLMRQVLYSLEYIHERGYAHGDIKGANLLLKTDNESYLVDFGLAFRFKRDGKHHAYEIKPERRHNGTIEYTSKDAHNGAQVTRRSDLEILGYCVIHWLCGTLPWINLITNPEHVQQSKIKSMSNPKDFVKSTLGTANISDPVKIFIEFYLNEINKLEFDTDPPYDKIHSKLSDCLQLLGHAGVDNFRLFKSEPVATKTPAKKKPITTATATTSVASAFANDAEPTAVATPSARKKRQTAKQIENEDLEEIDESIEELKLKTIPSSKKLLIEKPKTPLAKPKRGIKSRKESDTEEDESINTMSNIESYENDEVLDTDIGRNKKAKINMQSTKIEDTHLEAEEKQKNLKSKVKNLIIDNDTVEPKSPRNNIVKTNGTSSTLTPRTKRANYKELDSDQENAENISDKPQVQQNGFLGSNQAKLSPKSAYQNAAQLEMINKLKSKHNVAPLSPLALSNVKNEKGTILIKKRKNVPSATVSTQTDDSYLLTEYHNKMKY